MDKDNIFKVEARDVLEDLHVVWGKDCDRLRSNMIIHF
ncbi:hypothetical protein Gorai_007216 [Gossypium raimondii]|uniref:Uncharacterized protein n=1 Tax=Gossypium raimondii TaxID=29730 RepID=A0A7J8Q810_GOSRA|nr:hypothetical protein [Gossypium raimondii]